MSFDESVFAGGFIQKTVKEDLFVKANHVYPQRNWRGKTLEHSGRQPTKADLKGLTCGAGRPHLQAGRPMGPTCHPPLRMSVLHRILDYIYAIYSSQFDLRVHNWRYPLYIRHCTPLPRVILETLIHISHSDQHTLGGLGLELSNIVY